MANPNILEVEKSINELDAYLAKLRQISDDPGNPQNTPELLNEIAVFEERRAKLISERFANLTPWDKVLLARHEKRPYTLDYIQTLFDNFTELHGDRLYADDGAIIAGLARFEGRAVAVAGHQKGRDLKQRQYRNFGCARPEGYRKAARVFQMAAKFGLPIITFIDTAGAAADVAADERGISEAIARTMFEMATLPVPIVSIVIGEGGSGGAIGIAVADRVLMLEHSIYSVIAPESCAAILWRDPEKKIEAATALNLTAQRALELKIIDGIVAEPLGGAHRDWDLAAQNLKTVLQSHLKAIVGTPSPALVEARYQKYRHIGQFTEVTEAASAEPETVEAV